jgi:hypothetical protein
MRFYFRKNAGAPNDGRGSREAPGRPERPNLNGRLPQASTLTETKPATMFPTEQNRSKLSFWQVIIP